MAPQNVSQRRRIRAISSVQASCRAPPKKKRSVTCKLMVRRRPAEMASATVLSNRLNKDHHSAARGGDHLRTSPLPLAALAGIAACGASAGSFGQSHARLRAGLECLDARRLPFDSPAKRCENLTLPTGQVLMLPEKVTRTGVAGSFNTVVKSLPKPTKRMRNPSVGPGRAVDPSIRLGHDLYLRRHRCQTRGRPTPDATWAQDQWVKAVYPAIARSPQARADLSPLRLRIACKPASWLHGTRLWRVA